jgi:hypothetical protein
VEGELKRATELEQRSGIATWGSRHQKNIERCANHSAGQATPTDGASAVGSQVAACVEASLDTVGQLYDLLAMTANPPQQSALWSRAPDDLNSEQRAVAMCAIMQLLQLTLE